MLCTAKVEQALRLALNLISTHFILAVINACSQLDFKYFESDYLKRLKDFLKCGKVN